MHCPINHNSFSAAEWVKPGKGGHTQDDQPHSQLCRWHCCPCQHFPVHVGGIRVGGSWGGWETQGNPLPSQKSLLMLLGWQGARCPRDPILPGVWWPGMRSALAEVGVTWPAGSITP